MSRFHIPSESRSSVVVEGGAGGMDTADSGGCSYPHIPDPLLWGTQKVFDPVRKSGGLSQLRKQSNLLLQRPQKQKRGASCCLVSRLFPRERVMQIGHEE